MAITQLNNYLPGQDLTNLADNVDYNRVGDDKTDITINHGTSPWTFTIKVGSLIEKDGNIYTVDTIDYTLIATDNTHNYISFSGTAFASSANRGTYDPAKGGFYDSGDRILGIYIDGANDLDYYIDDIPEYILTTSTTWKAPFSKYYDIQMVGYGGKGGDAPAGTSRGGGGASAYGQIKIYLDAGDVWTSTLSSASGGSCSFDDGVTTLSVDNGFEANPATSAPGEGGAGGSGFDIIVSGDFGRRSYDATSEGGSGGNSFFGGAGGGRIDGAGTAGGYGSGGGGANELTTGTGLGGAGGPALIIIKG